MKYPSLNLKKNPLISIKTKNPEIFSGNEEQSHSNAKRMDGDQYKKDPEVLFHNDKIKVHLFPELLQESLNITC